MRRYFSVLIFLIGLLTCSTGNAQLSTGWKAHDNSRALPTVVTPAEKPNAPPSDAIVLFDGSDLSNWTSANGKGDAKWIVVDGAMESVPKSGYVATKDSFGDCQLHVEFASPKNVKREGQGRGNSGVFLMGEFEVQVLDSFENPTYADGSAASIYGQHPPLVNASRGPGQWQTYDIIFRRPRFSESGELQSPARITVIHNGVLVQDNSEAFGPTSWIMHRSYDKLKDVTEAPIKLQDHGNPVRYRNIWVRKLKEKRELPAKPYDPTVVKLTEKDAQNLVGKYGKTEVQFRDGKLFIKEAGQFLELIPHSTTEFGMTKSAGKITFAVDEQGRGASVLMELDAYGGNGREHKRSKD